METKLQIPNPYFSLALEDQLQITRESVDEYVFREFESLNKEESMEEVWKNEPDRVEFEAHGFPCLIVRNKMGALCGYVRVASDHPFHGKNYEEIQDSINVHGGLTYSDHSQNKICHTPKPGEPDDIFWFGFDCAHAWDLTPEVYEMEKPGGILHDMKIRFQRLEAPLPRVIYRDIPYVKAECERLALQLKKAKP